MPTSLRFYHYGDTAIFSDLKLQAELYKPNVGCIGIANPQEILHLNPMPGEMLTGEMSPDEGVLATSGSGSRRCCPATTSRSTATGTSPNTCAASGGARRAARRSPTPICCAPATGSSSTPKAACSRRKGRLSDAGRRSSTRRFALRDRRSAAARRRGPGEALVRVDAPPGLCAGDLYIYTGKNPYVTYPRIGCHEIAGVVEAYGPGAERPGDRHARRGRSRSSAAATAIRAASASAIAAPT